MIKTDEKTIVQGLNGFIEAVVPDSASKEQVEGTSEAFMAGASYCFCLLHEVFTCDDPELSKVNFKKITTELELYALKKVVKGVEQ